MMTMERRCIIEIEPLPDRVGYIRVPVDVRIEQLKRMAKAQM